MRRSGGTDSNAARSTSACRSRYSSSSAVLGCMSENKRPGGTGKRVAPLLLAALGRTVPTPAAAARRQAPASDRGGKATSVRRRAGAVGLQRLQILDQI